MRTYNDIYNEYQEKGILEKKDIKLLKKMLNNNIIEICDIEPFLLAKLSKEYNLKLIKWLFNHYRTPSNRLRKEKTESNSIALILRDYYHHNIIPEFLLTAFNYDTVNNKYYPSYEIYDVNTMSTDSAIIVFPYKL